MADWTTPKTDWITNPKPPEATDFNRIENNTQHLMEQIEAKKGAIVDAINDKGVDADIEDTYTELADKIRAIKQAGLGGIDIVPEKGVFYYDPNAAEIIDPIVYRASSRMSPFDIHSTAFYNNMLFFAISRYASSQAASEGKIYKVDAEGNYSTFWIRRNGEWCTRCIDIRQNNELCCLAEIRSSYFEGGPYLRFYRSDFNGNVSQTWLTERNDAGVITHGAQAYGFGVWNNGNIYVVQYLGTYSKQTTMEHFYDGNGNRIQDQIGTSGVSYTVYDVQVDRENDKLYMLRSSGILKIYNNDGSLYAQVTGLNTNFRYITFHGTGSSRRLYLSGDNVGTYRYNLDGTGETLFTNKPGKIVFDQFGNYHLPGGTYTPQHEQIQENVPYVKWYCFQDEKGGKGACFASDSTSVTFRLIRNYYQMKVVI